ncbi:type II toxin-antitoxin system CcdA family antitoxin [Sulfurisphaera ohwakuensis]|uniref:Post-segregation antitoxin (Ccd killing protein) n=1 Tax=Sulfurisphaera ohwakuensis TaxID=69656 RepID=A0A7J9RVN3_SULOH|nr:type II toxin-antitoxin system CcdA family antitoxin [Sulfurisphaera ohwakuensis]MBB5254881.1 post-segregation antitoxin (ccd killing protein) [Sulfurisphaera ohwakuensis]
MTEWVTISTKVRKEIAEKARKYGINISEVLRKALEDKNSEEGRRRG